MSFACHNKEHYTNHLKLSSPGKEQVAGIWHSYIKGKPLMKMPLGHSPCDRVCFIAFSTLTFPQILADEFPTRFVFLIT